MRNKWIENGKCKKKPTDEDDNPSDDEGESLKEAEDRIVKKIKAEMAEEIKEAMKEKDRTVCLKELPLE